MPLPAREPLWPSRATLREVGLADTVGYADPAQVARMFARSREVAAGQPVGGHCARARKQPRHLRRVGVPHAPYPFLLVFGRQDACDALQAVAQADFAQRHAAWPKRLTRR